MKASRTFGWLSAAVLSAAVAGAATTATAQDNPPANQGNAPAAAQQNEGGRQGGRRFDPAQFRQRMLDRLKQQLGMSDDEFAAVQPKIEKVFQLQRDARGGRMMGRRGGENSGPQSPVQTAREDLRKTLDNKDASADDIKAKLTALRDAESKAHDELVKAQDDLKSVLTQRQEAVLVMDGMLQ